MHPLVITPVTAGEIESLVCEEWCDENIQSGMESDLRALHVHDRRETGEATKHRAAEAFQLR